MNVAKGDCRTPLGSSEASVKGALQRARATLEARLPAGREHAPPPGSPRERQLASRFAAAVETSDIDAVLDLLTSDAWLTMPPEPYEYQGPGSDRQIPAPPGQPARRSPAPGTHPSQPPARLRLLPPLPPGTDRTALRDDRAHPRRRPHLRHHLVLRQQRVPPVRTAAHTAQMTCELARTRSPRKPRCPSRLLTAGAFVIASEPRQPAAVGTTLPRRSAERRPERADL